MMSVEKPEQPHQSTILDKTSKAFNRGFSTIHVRSNKEEKESDGDAKDFSEFAKQFAVSDAHMNGTKKPTPSQKPAIPVALSTDHTSKLRDKKRHSWGGAAFQAVLGPRGEKGNPNKLDTIFEDQPESSEAATQAGENTETATGKKEKKPKGKKGKKKDKSHNTEKSPKQPKKRKNSKDTITSHEEIAPLPRRRRSESSGSRLRNSSSNPEVGMKSLKLKKSDDNEDKDDNEKQGTGRDKDKKQEKKQKEKRDKELEKERKEKEKKERELEREQERRRDREKRDAEKKKSALRRLSIGRSNRGTVKKTILAASHNEIPLARTEDVDDLMMKRLAPDMNASDPGIVVTNKWRRNTFHAGDVGGNQAFLALLFNQPPPPEDGGGEPAAGKQGEGKEAGGARAVTPPPDSARAKPVTEAGNTPEADAKSAEEEKRVQEENRQLDIEIMKERERLSAVENEIQELMRQTAAKQPRKRSAPASMQTTSVVELILTPPTPRSLSGGSIEEERPSISSPEELLVPATIVQGE